MISGGRQARRGGLTVRLLLAGAALGLALPTAGFAVAGQSPIPAMGRAVNSAVIAFTPASIDPRLAKLLDQRRDANSRLMRFTPASAANRPERSVTVAVRVDDRLAKVMAVRDAIDVARAEPGAGAVRIAPTRFNLGIARGYHSFAPAAGKGLSERGGNDHVLLSPTPAFEVRNIQMPDLAAFKPGAAPVGKPGRLKPRIALEDSGTTGRAPKTLEGLGEQSIDVGGSYRVARNLDVTAGVRYSQDRDRITPLTDGTQDSQAVYVGTQFKF